MSDFFEKKKERTARDFIGNLVELGDIVASTRPGTTYKDVIAAVVVGFTDKKVRLQQITRHDDTNSFYNTRQSSRYDSSIGCNRAVITENEIFTKFSEQFGVVMKAKDVQIIQHGAQP